MLNTVRRLAGSAALLLVSILLSLLIAEGGLRLAIHHLPPAFLVYLHKQIKESHPELIEQIKAFNPWTAGREEDAEFGWTFKRQHLLEGINEEGERYRRQTTRLGFVTPDEPDPSELQLVTLGDSFMSTFYVTDPTPWVLRDALDLPVFNLAVAGWGPESYREAFKKYGVNRNAPAVAVFTFINDITDVDNWNRWKSSGGRLSFVNWLWIDTGNQDTVNIINNNNSWFDRNSVLWNLVRFAVSKVMLLGTGSTPTGATQAGDINKEIFRGAEGKAFELQLIKGYPFMTLDPDDFQPGGRYEGYMQAYFDSMLKLRDAIHSAGAIMILVWIPAKERVYLPFLPSQRFKKYVTNQTGRIDGLEIAISHFAEKNGIAYFDLTPELVRRAENGEKLYFTQDGHLNSHGNRVAGEAAAALIRRKLLKSE